MAAATGKKSWLERFGGLVATVAVGGGFILALVEFGPKLGAERQALAASLQQPTIPNAELTADDIVTYKDGSKLYEITYDVSTKNLSSSAVRITYSIVQLYVGELFEPDVQPGQAFEINDPPTPWNVAGNGAIHWGPAVEYDASLIDRPAGKDARPFLARLIPGPADKRNKDYEGAAAFLTKLGYQDLSPGGGMTGIVAPGDSTGTTAHFFLRAFPRQYAGVVVAYGIDGAVTSPDEKINLTSTVIKLSDAADKEGDDSSKKHSKKAHNS